MQSSDSNSDKEPVAEYPLAAGFLRRMGAVVYDALLLFSVLFFATALALPFNSGEAFAKDQFGFSLYLLLVSYLFYTWFWTHGGQTLGLKAWKLKVCNLDGSDVNWQQATVRFLVAILSWLCLGMGFFWSLISKSRYCWHDALSRTRLIRWEGENSSLQK